MKKIVSKIIDKIITYITIISPKLNTKIRYWRCFHKKINLKDPQTLDEKIQWLKFNTYYKNKLVTQCADKYAVRKYIEDCGCSEILNELYYVWDNVDEINWDELPDSFVIKWNFGCGHNLICRDKSKLDIEETKIKLNEWYKTHKTFYLSHSEIQYKNIPPKLICERLIETHDGNLPVDYKLYCFNGIADCALVCLNREKGHPDFYFFDKEWNLKRYNKKGKEAPENFTVPKPEGFELLFEYAEKITKPFPFVRADFYLEGGKVIFGELTFTPCGGFDSGRLPETQILFGNKVKISK